MFMTQQSIQAETAYRQERIKRDFQAANRRKRRARASRLEPRPARHALRPTQAA